MYKKQFPQKRRPSEQLVYGKNPVKELLHSGKDIEKLFVLSGRVDDEVKSILEQAKRRNIPVSRVPNEKLNRLTPKAHQGLVAFSALIQYKSPEHIIDQCYAKGKDPLFILLDGVTDVRNLGSIARSVECFNADALIFPEKDSAPINADAIKTSAGALNHIAVCRTGTIKQAFDLFKGYGIRTIGCSEKSNETIEQTDLSGPLAIVMGAEGDGLSEHSLRNCDNLAGIQITGNVGSLNVSVAAGIVLHHCFLARSVKK